MNKDLYLIQFKDNFGVNDVITIKINQIFKTSDELLKHIRQELKLKYYKIFPNKYCNFKILAISKLDDLLVQEPYNFNNDVVLNK